MEEHQANVGGENYACSIVADSLFGHAVFERLHDEMCIRDRAKEILAHEVTAMVHSKEEADKALEASKALFSQGTDSAHMPTTEIEASSFQDGKLPVLDLLLACGLVPSKGEGRRLIQQGGCTIAEQKVTDANAMVSEEDFAGGALIIKKGKKVFHKAVLKK